MGMNVEMFFIGSDAPPLVHDVIRHRLDSPPDAAGRQPDWGLPSSYDLLLANEPKRKVAVSPVLDGWIAGIESKEVVDFALLQELAETLRTDVVAVQLYEVAGSCGHAICARGIVREHRFSEDDDDPAGLVARLLAREGVAHGLLTFREAVSLRDSGWIIVSSTQRGRG